MQIDRGAKKDGWRARSLARYNRLWSFSRATCNVLFLHVRNSRGLPVYQRGDGLRGAQQAFVVDLSMEMRRNVVECVKHQEINQDIWM